MPFLFNCRVDIYRVTTVSDDSVGGAVQTGTIIYSGEHSRLDYVIPRQAITRPEGLETDRAYTFFFHTNRQHNLDIRENDTIILTFPDYHPEFGKRFRVRGVSKEANHPYDPRGIMEVYVNRIERSRGTDL